MGKSRKPETLIITYQRQKSLELKIFGLHGEVSSRGLLSCNAV